MFLLQSPTNLKKNSKSLNKDRERMKGTPTTTMEEHLCCLFSLQILVTKFPVKN